MRRIFGSRPTRFGRGDAVRLKTALPNDGLERGMVGTISEVRRTKVPSYDVQFISTNGVVGRFVVDESDLMPADGRKYDDNDVVRLIRDVPSRGLKTGTVGIVSEVAAGSPIEYTVEFVDANGVLIARTTLVDEDLASPDEAPGRSATAPVGGTSGEGPDEAGLADDQLDELIAELRSQGQAMQQETAQERATQARQEQQAQEEQQAQRQEQAQQQQQQVPDEPAAEEAPVQPAAGGGRRVDDAPPSDGRTTRFVRGESVRLDADLPSAGLGAGTEGVVTWVILGPPVSYLVEFAGGAPTKVEETYLSPAG